MANVNELKERALNAYQNLSSRERVLLIGGLTAAVVIGIYLYGISGLVEVYSDQTKRIKEVEQASEVAPDMLARYAKLLARRREIESFYEKIDLKEEPLSHIESLLRTKANAVPGSYTVQPKALPDFAGKYGHTGFTIKFTSTNLDSLVNFLRELVRGAQPMLLTQILIERNMSANALMVQLEVSSFQKLADSVNDDEEDG